MRRQRQAAGMLRLYSAQTHLHRRGAVCAISKELSDWQTGKTVEIGRDNLAATAPERLDTLRLRLGMSLDSLGHAPNWASASIRLMP